MTKDFLRIALVSRILSIIGQFIFNHLIPDHNAGVFESPYDETTVSVGDALIEFLFGGFRRWDAQYYLHIAEHGYTYENTLAFYPLYPIFVNLLTNVLLTFVPGISFRAGALVCGVLLNVFFFCLAAYFLVQLSRLVLKNEHMSLTVGYLFCINPASVFFSAPYSESLFAVVTFSVIAESVRGNILLALVPLSMGILCRSNGLINIGFVLYQAIRLFWLDRSFQARFKLAVKLLIVLVVSGFTFLSIQRYHFSLFCVKSSIRHSSEIVNYAKANDFILSGNGSLISSPWCGAKLPSAYTYVQSHYWNVGLFNYYEFKQIPNFILAIPILFLFLKMLYAYYANAFITVNRFGTRKAVKMLFFDANLSTGGLVYMVHVTFLTLVCVLFVHIQVTTRLLASSSPCLYWFAANYFKATQLNGRAKLILIWFGGYTVLGTILFSNNLPWT
ncbi:GPI mannosyltransferase 2 [Bradysia coprophila]|uniref:GPI mannosyltransferase 2 n=1 Tax=Bradysia coprophila TaxID=38358 RepID=UPI00187DA350|nr:GPI mannosyltransferase 2 [Bradysia coprophila]